MGKNLRIGISLVLLSIILMFAIPCFAQYSLKQDTVPKSQLVCPQKHSRVIKTNPLSMIQGQIILTGEYKLVYEFATNQHQSMQIGGAYIGKSLMMLIGDTSRGVNTSSLSVSGFRFQAAYKLFLIKKYLAPVGIYVGPFCSYTSATLAYKQTSTTTDYINLRYFNVDAMIGGQVIAGKIAIDGYLGLGYKYNTFTENIANKNYQMFTRDQFFFIDNHFKFLLGLNLGLAL
ncbi:MAG: hypothetical protein HXX09_04555 [Bacteroidetes bacterium]|nr:hypothetical protein [Bacteroidota bacterium]